MDSHQYLRGVNIKDVTTVSEIPSELKPYTMAIGAVVILLGMLLAFQGKRTYRVSEVSSSVSSWDDLYLCFEVMELVLESNRSVYARLRRSMQHVPGFLWEQLLHFSTYKSIIWRTP